MKVETDFCQQQDMVVTNKYFKLHERRLYTWESPADNVNKVIRNQMDFILIKK